MKSKNLNFGSRISVALTLAALVLISGCATHRIGNVYEGRIGKDPLTFSCDGPGMTDSPCRLATGTSNVQLLRFSTERTQYSHLLKQGIEGLLRNPKRPDRPSDADVSLLRNLALDDCHPAETSKLWSGDLLQLCIPSDASAVILFIRGVCDRCKFEPIVLKRKPTN